MLVHLKSREFINRTSKIVGLDLSYLMEKGSWIGLRFTVMIMGSWLVSLLFAQISTKEILGQYQYVLSVISLLTIISLPGLRTAAIEAVVKGREAVLLKVCKMSLLLSLFAVPILIGFGIYSIYWQNSQALGRALIISSVLVPFYNAFNVWTSYFDGKSLFKEESIKLIILNIALNSSLIIALYMRVDLLRLVLTYLLVNSLFNGYYFFQVTRKIKKNTSRSLDIKFGISVSIQKFVYGLSTNLPPIIISFVFNIELVAVYYIAYYVISAVFSMFGIFGIMYIPKFFKGQRLDHAKIFSQNLIMGLVLWLLFVVFLKKLFMPLYGQEYEASRQIAYKISLLMIIVPFKAYFINYFMTQKKNIILIVSVLLANIISFILLYLARNSDFSRAIIIYAYALEIVTVTPLFINYISRHLLPGEREKGVN